MEDERRVATLAELYRLLMQHHDQSEDGHRRLREDFRHLESRLLQLENDRLQVQLALTRIESTLAKPTEVSALRFTPAMVMSVIVVCASILSGAGGVIYSMRELGRTQETQAKINDERFGALKSSVDEVKRMQQLQQYEFQSFKETFTGKDKKHEQR